MCGHQELTGSLQELLSQAVELLKGQEITVTAVQLATLTLDGDSEVPALSSGSSSIGTGHKAWT